jgi:DNA replication protein DnaC
MEKSATQTIEQHKQQSKLRAVSDLTPLSRMPNASNLRQLIENAPCVSDDEINAMFQCAKCKDSGWLYLEKPLRRCDCRLEKIRVERFNKAVETTPRKFREQYGVLNGLESIAPDNSIHPKHSEILAMLKRNKEKSFYFFGKTGTHKTTFAWALLQEAGRRGQKVGGNTGRQLADSIRNYSLHQTVDKNASFYSLAQLDETSERFCVLIDEIELFPVSEYSLSTLFELVDKVQSNEQQIVITSNKTMQMLMDKWIAMDKDGKANAADYCEKLTRRFTEVCVMVDLS